MKKLKFLLVACVGVLCVSTFSACSLLFGSSEKQEEEIPDAVTVDIYSVSDFTKITREAPVNVIIHNDIDVENLTFTAVSANENYENTIQGNGYTIKNILLMGSTSRMFVNFTTISDLNIEVMQANLNSVVYFGAISSSATTVSNCSVKDLTVTIASVSGEGKIGAIVGKVGTLENCFAENIDIKVTGAQNVAAGGIAGASLYTVTDCSVSGIDIDVKLTKNGGYDYIGGVVGNLEATSSAHDLIAEDVTINHYCVVDKYWGATAYLGGVSGRLGGSTTLMKAFTKDVTISGTEHDWIYAGGISGAVSTGAQLMNSGSVNFNADIYNTDSDGYAAAGGVSGNLRGTMMSCYSYNAKISGKGGFHMYAGGVTGYIVEGVMTYCASINMRSGTIAAFRTATNSYPANGSHYSAIAGYSSGSMANCKYLNGNNVSFNKNTGEPVGITSEDYTAEFFTSDLKFLESYWDFSGLNKSTDDEDTDDEDEEVEAAPYPVLK